MPRRDPVLALQQMRDHAAEATGLVADRERADLDTDRVLALALTRLVEIVGEAGNRVPPEAQARIDLPWQDIIGMRHRLIHGYDAVDLDVLWQTLVGDLPDLVQRLDRVLDA